MARLDVAMFNCILCDSDDEIPTDPVSVPISEAKVLPLPAGKSSFGAGALLKNAVRPLCSQASCLMHLFLSLVPDTSPFFVMRKRHRSIHLSS